MAKIFMTGGAGYLGSTLVPHLLGCGHQVTVLDDFRYDETSLLNVACHEKFKVERGDARDERLVRRLVRDADVIIPLAAVVGAPACKRAPTEAISINTDAVTLLNHLRSRSQRILFPTTNSGYGNTDATEMCTEDSPLDPVSLYGRTKVEAESILLESENAVTFRLATVFGVSPRLRLDLLVNDFTYRAFKDRCLILFEADFIRNYVSVQDVADLLAWVIGREEPLPDGPYNFGLSEANYTKRQLCEIIQREVPDFTFLESAVGTDPDQRNYLISNHKIEAAGFAATTTVTQGVRDLLKAFAMITHSRYGNF